MEVIFLKNLLQWSVLFNDVGVSKLYLDTNALQFFRGLDEFLRWNDPMIVEMLVW